MPPSNDDLRSWAALDGKRLMNVLSYRATLAELLAVVKAHRENGEEMRGRVGGGVREDRRGEERWGEGKEGGEGREEESVGEGKVGEGGGGEDRGEEGNVFSKRVKGQKDGKASTGLSPVHICTAFHRIAKHAKRMGGGRRLVDRLKEDETVRWLGRQVEALAKGGRLKGQALANVAWAQAELGHGPPSLLNTVMAASLAQIKSFQPLEVAILMHALGSTAGLPAVNASLARDLLGRLTWEHVIGSLHCFQPRHVKEILWAHARVGLHSHLLFREAAKLVLSDMSSYSAPQLAIIAWSFAKLHHSDDSLFRALAAWAESNAPAFASQDTSNMLWAFARLNVNAPSVFALFVPRVIGSIQEHSTQSLSNIAWAYATAGHRSQQLLEALGEESTRRIVGGTLEREAVSGQAVANIAWALATQSHYDVAFFSAAAAHATRYMPRYAGRTIACLAFAFALIGHTAPPLFLRVESEIIRRLALRSGEQEFGRQALVMLAWALVVHGQTDSPSAAPAPPAAAAPSSAAPPITSIATTTNSPSTLPSSSSPSSSASLSPALPILRHHLLSLTTDLTSSELCQLYQVDLATQLEAPEHNTRLVEGGMGVMGHAGRSTSGSGSEGDGEWGEQDQESQGEEEEERDESYWYLQHLWLSGFVRQQAKACWEAAHEEEKVQVSGLQRDISCALHQMHLPHTLEYRDGDYSIDLALLLPLAATESTGSDSTRSDHRRRERRVLKIAVEADGPSHFTISTSGMTTEQQHQQHSQQHPHQHNQQQQHVPLGPTRLKARLLRCRGWQVVQIPFFEWECLSDLHQKQQRLESTQTSPTSLHHSPPQIPFFEWECLSDLHQKQTYLAARLGPLAMQLAREAEAADADVAQEEAGRTGEGRTEERRIEEGGSGEGRTGEDETGLSDKQQEEEGLKEGRVAEEAEQVGGGEFKPGDGEGKEVDEKVEEGEEGAERRKGGDVSPEKSQKEGEEEEEEERRKGGDVLKRAEVLGAWKAGQAKGGLGADRLALLRKAAVRRGLTQK
ncbi:unnamed protein product [Closterium sp. Naga37s-1]|nr:unnamed protein product [Closterium sp. Naga37s-1]